MLIFQSDPDGKRRGRFFVKRQKNVNAIQFFCYLQLPFLKIKGPETFIST